GAFGQQVTDDGESRSKANIVGVRFKGQPPHPDLLASQHPQFLLNLLHKVVEATQIDPLDLLQQRKIASQLLGDPDESLEILGEAESSKANPGSQETRPDPSIQADAFRHFVDIGPGGLAQVSNEVNEGDFHGQEGI